MMAVGMCLPCHAAVVQSYAATGMARSFYRLTAETRVEDFERNNRLEHRASQTTFTMTQRGGRFYMRANELEMMLEAVVMPPLQSVKMLAPYFCRPVVHEASQTPESS